MAKNGCARTFIGDEHEDISDKGPEALKGAARDLSMLPEKRDR